MNDTIRTIAPDFYVIRYDETDYWSEDIQEKAEKVYGMYLFDKNEATFCAEITPSYCLYPMYGYPLRCPDHEDSSDESTCDIVAREFDRSEVTYVHTSSVDRRLERGVEGKDFIHYVKTYDTDEWETAEAYAKLVEDTVDDWCANPDEPGE